MWQYQQSTGVLSQNGMLISKGYSGNTTGLNNPAAQEEHMVGPIPQGKYTIGGAQIHPKLGPLAMPLNPAPDNEMFGRSGFFIHGDNTKGDKSASDGCIILDHATRFSISQQSMRGDDQLTVIA